MLWSYFIFVLVVNFVSGQNSAPAILNHVDEGEVCKNLTDMTDQQFNNNYNRAIEGKLENIGHTLKFTPNDKSPNVEVKAEILEANTVSCNTISTGVKSLEKLHLVHYGLDAQGNATTKLAVLGIFLKVDRGDGTPTSNISRALRVEEQTIRNPGTFKKQEGVKQILADKLPTDRNCFIRYMGSLTTEPALKDQAQMTELRALVDNSPKHS
uniref:Alpha-carbonic anhydrase domain-containing protein n=1 Tax=Ditylenchus dipsaci TaxID=166011 RepID=A0A915DHJ7_9BILA